MPDYYRSRRRRLSSHGSVNLFLISNFTRYLFFSLIAGIIFLFLLFLWYSRELPTPGKLSESNLPQSTKILDRNGAVLYDIYSKQNRTYVELSEVPKTLQQTTIAIEDKDFYVNQGFSVMGYLRAIRNVFFFRGISGGSTLTQQ